MGPLIFFEVMRVGKNFNVFDISGLNEGYLAEGCLLSRDELSVGRPKPGSKLGGEAMEVPKFNQEGIDVLPGHHFG